MKNRRLSWFAGKRNGIRAVVDTDDASFHRRHTFRSGFKAMIQSGYVCLSLAFVSASTALAAEKAAPSNASQAIAAAEQQKVNEEANAFSLAEIVKTTKAVDSEPVNETYTTGLVRPTPEKEAEQRKNGRVLKKVLLNKIGFARINAGRAKKGLPSLIAGKDVQVMSVGQDVLSVGSSEVDGEAPLAEAAFAATGAEEGSIPAVGAGELPSAVDNSTLQYFPPIGSQWGGSCAAWCGIYYNMTHEMSLAYNWNAKTGGDDSRFTPMFSYNLVNDGLNEGTWMVDHWIVASAHGIPRWSQFYVTDSTSWCTNPSAYRSALSDRIQSYMYINDVHTDTGLAQLKEFLNNGHTAAYGTYGGSWQYSSVVDDPATTNDDAYVGKQIVYMVNGTASPHGMTVVGYNDDLWCDINTNGVVEANEKGALRVANSFGPGWRDGGFCWVSYAAVRTRNPADTVWGIFWYDDLLSMTPRATRHTPTVVARVTLNHNFRNQVRAQVGIGSVGAASPSSTISPYILANAGGPYAFSGEVSTPQDFTYYMDFSDVAPAVGVAKRWFLKVIDSGSNDGNLTVKDFRLYAVNAGTDELVGASFDTPVVANGSTNYVWVDWTMGERPPCVEVAASDPSAAEAGADTGSWRITRTGSTSGPLTVYFSLSGTAAVGTDYSIDATSPVTIPAGASSVTITMTPIDDSDHEGNETVDFKIIPNTSYCNGGTAAASIVIADNDNNAPLVYAGPDQIVTLQNVLWTPAEMATVAWYDANDASTITKASGKVSQWDDKSGKGNNAVEMIASRQPTYQAADTMVGNRPSIGNISGSGQIGLKTPSIAAKNIYVVTYYNNGLVGSFNGNPTLVSGPGTYGRYRVMGAGTAFDLGNNSFNSLGTYKNGSSTSSVAGVLPMPAAIFKFKASMVCTQVFALGYNQAVVDRDWSGYYSEFIFTDGTEDLATEQKIEGYLAHKWGLAGNLPVGHPYKNVAPGTPGVTVHLDGASVTDADGDDLTGNWSVVSKPAGAMADFDDINLVNPSIAVNTAGSYVLRLTATDGIEPVFDDVTVNVTQEGALPVVTIAASDGSAAEAGSDTGSWTISRTGDTTNDLAVYFSLSGTATYGADYSLSGTSPVTILFGQSSVTITLTPVDDSQREANETALLSITPDAAYAIGGSSTGTITIADNDNTAPVANAQSVTTAEDTAKAITLTGSDADGDALSYAIVTAPAHGTLSGTAPNVTYTPAANYSGADSFTFKVNDGAVDSSAATVSITVSPVNDRPVVNDTSVSTATNTAVAITLSGSDADGDALSYSIVTGPANGTLSGTAPHLVYTPNSGFAGVDSLTFKATDGSLDSDVATVSVTVNDGAVVIRGDIVAHYRFDDGAGSSIAVDSGPFGLNATLRNMDSANDWVTGTNNGALDFDGVNDYVSGALPVDMTLSEGAVSFWTKVPLSAGSWDDWFSLGTGAGTIVCEIDSSGMVCIYNVGSVPGASSMSSGVNVKDGLWHEIVFTFSESANEAKLFIDGEQAGTTVPWSSTATITGLVIGSRFGEEASGGRNIKAVIDDFKVYRATAISAVTMNHSVPYTWLAGINPAWTNDYETAVMDDPDGDGFSTWEEYWSGTDPQSSNSCLKIDSIVFNGTNVIIQWQHAEVGAIPPIVIESSTNLATGPWVITGQKTPVEGTNSWSNTAAQSLFYRLAVTNAQ